jgi:hypothetical protein
MSESPKSSGRAASAKGQPMVSIDYRSNQPLPKWVRDVIDESLAIESESARSAGTLGFMSRALVLATMPYRDPKSVVFERQNGDFKLRILAGYEGGVPYGVYPRLLMSWVTTEAVRTQSPELNLGDSLAAFLRDVMDVRVGGGVRGSATRVSEQMKRLFGSFVTAQYSGKLQDRGFRLKNIMIAEEAEFTEADLRELDRISSGKKAAGKDAATPAPAPGAGDALWQPQAPAVLGQWQSKLRLTNTFFQECVSNPVPIDLRAYKALRGSAMAMDIYTWLTWRMSGLAKPTRPIPWEALQVQFGTSLALDEQGKRDFKKAFLKYLKIVLTIYPQANVEVTDRGLVLKPSRPHIPAAAPQQRLF